MKLNISLIRVHLGVALITLMSAVVAPHSAQARDAASITAHPLGNFSVNRYSRLEFGREQTTLLYIVDMAEIPTLQERNRMDADQNGSISADEQAKYVAQQVAAWQPQLRLALNGVVQTWRAPTPATLEFVPGQGGLQTMRMTLQLSAPSIATQTINGDFQDGNFEGRLGWREIIVRGGDGATLPNSSAPSQDRSDELRNYPQDLLQSPLAIQQASFQVQLASVESAATGVTLPAVAADPAYSPIPATRADDAFARLIRQEDVSLSALLLALLAAFGWGTVHAFSPGHGKTIVGAYLIGSRATAKHALFLGATTTITHTLGVFALGLLTLFASSTFLPERLYPWLEALSGGLVVLIGVSLFGERLRQLWRSEHGHSLHTLHHEHTHNHHHDHAALLHDHGDGHIHSHSPPGANGDTVTWRSLLMLGISGGLLPCPSALVVMLGAIALHRIGFGLLLVVAFSLGLAGTLTAIGLLMVYARRWFERANERHALLTRIPLQRWAFSVAPVLSALAITLAGLGITWQALLQTGWL